MHRCLNYGSAFINVYKC